MDEFYFKDLSMKQFLLVVLRSWRSWL